MSANQRLPPNEPGYAGTIFSTKATDYAAARPDYPAQLFETLRTTCQLDGDSLVADIGAGTGLLTRGLLQQGWRVVAVEPNPQMRASADKLLGQASNYRSAEGFAESIPLADGSVELITAAQAFHWFEIEKARAEFLRVLRPAGQVALIWNDRVLSDPLHIALDEVFAEFGGEKRGALVPHEERGNVPKFFGATMPKQFSSSHQQLLDENGLSSLVFSRSYMPQRDSDAGRRLFRACDRSLIAFPQMD